VQANLGHAEERLQTTAVLDQPEPIHKLDPKLSPEPCRRTSGWRSRTWKKSLKQRRCVRPRKARTVE
jgi:hypothetical protein